MELSYEDVQEGLADNAVGGIEPVDVRNAVDSLATQQAEVTHTPTGPGLTLTLTGATPVLVVFDSSFIHSFAGVVGFGAFNDTLVAYTGAAARWVTGSVKVKLKASVAVDVFTQLSRQPIVNHGSATNRVFLPGLNVALEADQSQWVEVGLGTMMEHGSFLDLWLSINDAVPPTAVVEVEDVVLAAAGTMTIGTLVSGAPASPGPAGPTGPVGPTGAVGATGATGPAGLVGATGPTGGTGARGTTGSTGPAGASGVAGVTGSSGAKGTTGATGPEGVMGMTGPVGAVWRGSYSGGVTYNKGDVVGTGGSSYIAATGPVTGVAPPSAQWSLVAEKGTTGSTGPSAPIGAYRSYRRWHYGRDRSDGGEGHHGIHRSSWRDWSWSHRGHRAIRSRWTHRCHRAARCHGLDRSYRRRRHERSHRADRSHWCCRSEGRAVEGAMVERYGVRGR